LQFKREEAQGFAKSFLARAQKSSRWLSPTGTVLFLQALIAAKMLALCYAVG